MSELHQTIEEFRVERLEGFVVSQLFCTEEAVSYSINLLVSPSVNQPVSQSVCQQFSWPVCQPVSLLASLRATQSVCPVSRSVNQSVSLPANQSISQLVCLSVPLPPLPTQPLRPLVGRDGLIHLWASSNTLLGLFSSLCPRGGFWLFVPLLIFPGAGLNRSG